MARLLRAAGRVGSGAAVGTASSLRSRASTLGSPGFTSQLRVFLSFLFFGGRYDLVFVQSWTWLLLLSTARLVIVSGYDCILWFKAGVWVEA